MPPHVGGPAVSPLEERETRARLDSSDDIDLLADSLNVTHQDMHVMNRRPGSSVTIIVLFATAAVAGLVVHWTTSARTYSIRTVFQMAYAIWSDDQLLIAVRTRHDGSLPTVSEDVQRRVSAAIGFSPERPRRTHRSVATILQVNAGRVREISQVVPSYREVTYPPRFIDGRPYLMGGVWTGERVEDVPRELQSQLRWAGSAPATGEDPGVWQYGMVMGPATRFPYPPRSSELQVRVRGESMTLRANDDTTQVIIELLRADGKVERVWSQSTTPRGVSVAEFESILGRTHPR